MFKARSLFAKLAIAIVVVLAGAMPVFAANTFKSNNNGDAAGTSVVVDKPIDLAVGDVMIASVAYRGPNTTTVTPPTASWTEIAKRTNTQNPDPDTTLVTFWKAADAADVSASNFTFTLSVGARAFAGIARYDDVDPTAPIVVSATNPAANGNLGQSSSLTANAVTTTQPGSYVTAIYALFDGTTISSGPNGMSALYNEARTSGTDTGRLAAFDVSQTTPGTSNAKVATAASNVRYVSQTIALKPEPTKLGFSTSPRTGVVNDCLGPITVQTQNSSSVAVNPLSATEVGLATDNGSTGAGSFFSDSGCTTGLTQADRTIATNQTGTTFYYKATDRGNGSHVITATATGLTQAQQTETVKLAQAITFAQPPSPQIYGDEFDIGSATSDSGLTVTVTPSGGCTLVGTTATVTSATTDCTLTATQDGDSTYAAATPVVQTVVTDPLPIEVTADPGQSKVYSNNASTDPVFTYQVTDGALINGNTFSGALARAAGETVAGSPYAINQGNLSAGTNYAITFVGADFAITKKPLNVNAQNKSKTYGGSDPALTATLSGFVSGQNANNTGITGSALCSRDAGEAVQGGTPYTITCAPGDLLAPNYSFQTGTTGNFTINKKELAVDADPASKTYGDSDPATFPVSFTGFAFTDTASVVSGAAACSRANVGVDEDVNTYNDVITCLPGTLTADNYSFAGGAPGDFTINQRAAHATFTAANKVYNQSTAAAVTFTGLTNVIAADQDAGEVELTGTPSGAFSTASAGQNKTVTVSGVSLTGTRVANYTLVVDNPTANITPLQLTPSFTAANRVYDRTATAAVTGRSVSGVLSPDAVSLTGGTASFANKTVGNGKTVTLSGATLSGAQAGNYSLPAANPTTTANITAKSVTGSFTAADKDFDNTAAATITGRSLAGAITGDTVSLTGGTATFNNANPGVDKPVTGTGFSLGGADAGNYTLSSVGATTATIRQRDPEDTPPSGGKSLSEKAADLLGGDVKTLGLNLGGLGFAFAPADQTGTLKVGKGALTLFAIGGCPSPCTIDAAKTLVLKGEAGASAAATKRIKLKTQKLSLAANQLGVIKLKLTKKQRKAIKKANKAKAVVKVTLKSGTQTATAKKAYKLKLKKG